ncbi:hypothetical protein EBZ80_20130 [bacterium]|nr:hypothetical protein [bacterium]
MLPGAATATKLMTGGDTVPGRPIQGRLNTRLFGCLLSVFAGLTVSWSRYVALLEYANLLRSCSMNGLMTLSSVRWRWSGGSPHRGFPGPLLPMPMPLAEGPLQPMLLVGLSVNLTPL